MYFYEMVMNKNDEYFMKQAIAKARIAAKHGEVPIGAVIVKDDEIISTGRNMREAKHNALHHAEIIAIDRACKKLNAWRLIDCTLYVTMEPCPMCTGAAINARIPRIVYGVPDPRAGACGSLVNLPAYPLEERPSCLGGVREEECCTLLRDFFSELRKKRKNKT